VFSFFTRKKKAAQKIVRAQPTAEQKRASFRMPVEFDVLYTLRGRAGRRHGRATDLSSGGLRLTTDEDLPRGAVLDLDFRLPDEFLAEMKIEKELFEQTPFGLRPESIKTQPPPFAPMRLYGEVRSAFFDQRRASFAYGLQFVEIDPKVHEELERFIHLWQIHYIRSRHAND
jgi:hypothetical protein